MSSIVPMTVPAGMTRRRDSRPEKPRSDMMICVNVEMGPLTTSNRKAMAKASQKAPYEQCTVVPKVLPQTNSMMPATNCAAPPKKTARPKTAWKGPTSPCGLDPGRL